MSLLTFSLVALILVTFLWATYRSIASTARSGAAQRAEAVGQQLARLLGQSAQQSMALVRSKAALETVRNLFLEPTDEIRRAATADLLPSRAPTAERWEVWTADGRLVHSAETPGATADLFPTIPPPTARGIGPLRLSGSQVSGDAVEEVLPPVPTTSSPPSAPIGFVRRRTIVRTETAALEALVGGGATVGIGNQQGDVWIENDRPSPKPSSDLGRAQVASSVQHRGQKYVAATTLVPGTPWTVWVGFPEHAVVEPAGRFLKRMGIVALAFLVLAGIVTEMATRRITQPLSELTEAAAGLARGEYRGPLAVRRMDEIGVFAQTFNVMSGRIADAQTQLRNQLVELRGTTDRLRAVVASVPMTLWSVDGDGIVTLMEGPLLQRIGIDPTAVVGRPASALDSRMPQLANQTHRVLSGESVRWVAAVEGLSLDAQYVPRRDDAGAVTGAIGVAMDVTERQRLETQLRQAQKMEAIGQLAGGIAHDFNNLLTAILGYGELLKIEESLSAAAASNVEEILRAGHRAADLTRQLLAFSRHQVLQPDIVSLKDVVEGIVPMLRRLIGEHVELSLALDPKAGRVRADPGQLAQVVMNLAINARDAMPEGGRITIETAAVQLDEDYVRNHPEVTPGPYVMLAVSDTGHGIDERTRTRIFEPFFTTKERGRGTGLGLATVYGIVKQAAGSIWLYSEVGRGTTFKIYLPRTDAEASAQAPQPLAAVKRGSGSILVVEDEESVRLLIVRLLTRAGYEVTAVEDPPHARLRAADAAWQIDLLISDVVMPAGTGPDLFEELRRGRPTLQVLFISGYAPGALKQGSQIPSNAAFLQKPFSAQAFLQKVQELLPSRS